MGLSPEPPPMLLDTSTNVCGSKKAWCHSDLSRVSRCHRGESEDHASEKACKGSILTFKYRADITRSPNSGINVSTKRNHSFKI